MTLNTPNPTGGIDLRDLYGKARSLQERRAQNPALAYASAILNQDLWHGGAGWNGPMPKGRAGDDESIRAALEVLDEVKRTFVSRNLSADVVSRHVHGIAGKEPLWSVLPEGVQSKDKLTPAQQKQADEYEAALSAWLEEAGGWRTVQEMLLSGVGLGIGLLRLYVHRSKLVGEGGALTTPSPDDLRGLADAAKLLSIMQPSYQQAGVVRDSEGHVIGAYHSYVVDNHRTRLELHQRIDGGVRIYPDYVAGENNAFVEYPVPDTLIWELSQKPLITPSMRSLQRMLDKVFTMGSRNMDLGGFTERTVLNAMLPGQWKTRMVNGKEERVYVRDKLFFGAGVTNNFNGLPLERLNPETGQAEVAGLTTPSIIYRDPTSFDTFAGAIVQAREAIYDEAKQLHVLITGDASASGVSRQQAVNDFVSSLEPTKHSLEQMMRWLLSSVLRMALHFAGRGSEVEGWRVSVQARVSAVQPTPSDVDTALRLHETGAISEEEFAGRIGIEDWEAEKKRRADEGITPAIAMKLLDKALPTWVHLQASMLAFPALGITPADVARQKEAELSAGLAPDRFDDDDADDEGEAGEEEA